jgi:phosphoribosylanthranilate isomerase
MIIKVCGLRDAENIRAVEEALAPLVAPAGPVDTLWTGFIFYPPSPRAAAAFPPAYLPQTAHRVGVFVSPSEKEVQQAAAAYGLKVVQLHGDVSPAFCRGLRSAGKTVVRVLPGDASSLRRVSDYADAVDYFLFDTPTATHGGSGKTFDWQVLQHYDADVPFLLGGGIGPEALPALTTFHHPRWCGLDLNSRFEVSPGVKDAALLRRFVVEWMKRR